MSNTIPTNITIWQDIRAIDGGDEVDGDYLWRIEFHEDARKLDGVTERHLKFGPFETETEAYAWIQEAVTVPLSELATWAGTRRDTRIEFASGWFDNEVPDVS